MFWRRFKAALGPPGEKPESYWGPALGHVCHLRPADINDLTPAQLFACFEAIKSFNGD